MDLLFEKLDGSRHYLSQYKVLITDFEESAPSVTRNNKQLDQRNGSIDFGGWHTDKTINITGYYRADDMDEEETLREKLYALLSDPDGYYITQLKTTPSVAMERPGETSGGYYDKLKDYPSHKRFLVYTEAPELELVGNVNGTLLYKLSVEFKTIKLPYGETPAKDVAIDSPYKGLPTNYVLSSHARVSNETDKDAYPKSWSLSENLAGKTITTVAKVIVTNYQGKISSSDPNSYIDIKDGHSTGQWEGLINFIIITGNGVYTSVPKTMIKHTPTGEDNQISIEMYNLNATVEVWVKVGLDATASPWSPNPADPEYYADRPYDYDSTNLLRNTGDKWNPSIWSSDGTATAQGGLVTATNTTKSVIQTFVDSESKNWLTSGAVVTISVDVKGTGGIAFGYNTGSGWEDDSWTQQINSSDYIRVSFTRTIKSVHFEAGTPCFSVDAFCPKSTLVLKRVKLNRGTSAYPWSPNPADPEYNDWLRGTTGTISVTYSGSVPCNQLEQGFTIELTALSSASSLSFKIGDAELTYNGDVAKDDVFRFSGFSYTKNNLSIVDKTNKAYFVLRPDKPNRITCNVFGKIRVLGFQNFYA